MAGSGNIPVATASSSSFIDASLNGLIEIGSHQVTVEMGYSDDEECLRTVRSEMDITPNDMKLVQRWKSIFLGVVRAVNFFIFFKTKYDFSTNIFLISADFVCHSLLLCYLQLLLPLSNSYETTRPRQPLSW